MKTIKNDKLIKRNAQIGSWTSIAALVVLAGGMYISFKQPELFVYSMLALLLGFTLTQIGMYMGNKFGRSPRPDEKLDAGLKGFISKAHDPYIKRGSLFQPPNNTDSRTRTINGI